MNAIALFTEDGKKTNVSYCAKCKIPAPHDIAEKCCTTTLCEDCGEDTGYSSVTRCSECSEKLRMSKAEKLENWTGGVLCGGRFYESMDDFLGCHSGEDLPEYLWIAEDTPFPTIVFEDFLQEFLENLGIEEADESMLNGVTELASAFYAFNEANEGKKFWFESSKRAAVVPKATTP